MGKLSYVIATALLGLATNAFAVNFADVYQAAVENDPVLGAAQQDYAAREEVVPQTRAGLLPSINLNGSTAYNRLEYPDGRFIDTDPASPSFGQLRGIDGQDYNTHGWQAQLVQPLLDVAAYYTYKSAQALKAQAKQDYVASEQNLIVRTIGAYLDVLRSQAVLDSTNAEEAAVKRQQEQVQQRFDVGLVAITDVLDATAAYDNVVVRRIQAEADQGIQFETLSTLTGESYEQIDQLSTNLPIVNPVIDRRERVGRDRARQQSKRTRVARGSNRRGTRLARPSSRTSADDRCRCELQRKYHSRSTTRRRSSVPRRRHQFARVWVAAANADLSRRLYQSRVREARARLLATGIAAQQRMDGEPRYTKSVARRDDRRDPRAGAHQSDQVERVSLEATQTGYEVGRATSSTCCRLSSGCTRRSSITPILATTTCAI